MNKGIDESTSDFAEGMSSKFIVAYGEINQIGSLEKSSTHHLGGVTYQASPDLKVHRATVTELISREISLLKIGDLVLTEINVPKTAVFEIMQPGEIVSCIFTADQKTLLYAINHTTNTGVGSKPDNIFKTIKVVTFVGFVLCLMGAWGMIQDGKIFNTLVFLGLAAGCYLISRICGNIAQLNEIYWNEALQQAQVP